MPDPDAGRTLAEIARDFGAAARDHRRRRWGQCLRKQHYATQADAEHVVAYRRGQGDATIHAYPCPFVPGRWHVGHP